MTAPSPDLILDVENAVDYVAARAALSERVGRVREVSASDEGKLNGVLFVVGERGSLVLKQSLPWIRTLPDWSLGAERLRREVELLRRWSGFNPGFVPEILAFDDAANVVAMEYLHEHVLLRDALRSPLDEATASALSERLGGMIARAACATSLLGLDRAEYRAAVERGRNAEMTALMHDVVFAMPFLGEPLQMSTALAAEQSARIRQDEAALAAIEELAWTFETRCEALLHGDLHTGSIMVDGADVRIIDAEFGRYGPVAWDLGELLGHLVIAEEVHAAVGDRAASAEVGSMVERVVQAFLAEMQGLTATLPHARRAFAMNWAAETAGSAIRFGGVEILRRIIGVGDCEQLRGLPDAAFAAALTTLVERGRAAVVEGEW